MEIITSTVAVAVWEYALKPIVDSIKKEYGDETKNLLKSLVHNVLSKEEIDSKSMEVIEAEIVEMSSEVLSDKEKFLESMANNPKIRKITNSFTKIENSKIEVDLGEVGEMADSVKNIKDSTIVIR